jgi:NAD(P)-dependent dehydrogenase (short-subunit alcohol dehydrogenase family)
VDGQTFLVTGGGSGLGAACVRRLVAAGASVVAADINPDGQRLADELGERVRFERVDVLDEDSVRRAVAAAADMPGGLRGVVHCAGVIHAERVVSGRGTHPLDAFRRVIEVNLVGTFNVVRLVAEALRDRPPLADPDADATDAGATGERGVIVMTASVAAFEGQTGQAAYAASKGGVAALALPLARDLSRYGIRVVAIAPGVFETPMMSAVTDDYRRGLTESVPFPSRLGRPEEFAALAQHIIENPYLNGSMLRLDAALRMPPR